ncbi:MAG: glycosyltransferase [Deltaproteobacteria bacterium]|nr:glycosyltransferase [Deltaproteobacteria bacterium]
MSRGGKKVTISACMMVKDGGDLFARALTSLRGVVDELVLVNTDESPETPDTEAARAVMKCPVTILHRPWQRDFSLHRNQSLEAATGDWLLLLDADEELVLPGEHGPQLLRKKLGKLGPEYDAVGCAVEDYRGGVCKAVMTSVRLFRRGRVHFVGRVHNEAVFEGRSQLVTDMSVRHFGYDLASDKMAAKFERTHGLLLEELAENPDSARPLFFLMQICGEHGRDQEAIAWGEKYLARRDELGPDFQQTIYYSLASFLRKNGQGERALAVIRMGLHDNPLNIDLAYLMSEYGVETKRPYLVADGARRYVAGYQAMQADPRLRGNSFIFSDRPEIYQMQLFRLATASLAEGLGAMQALMPAMLSNPKIRDDLGKFMDAVGLGQAFRQMMASKSKVVQMPARERDPQPKAAEA